MIISPTILTLICCFIPVIGSILWAYIEIIKSNAMLDSFRIILKEKTDQFDRDIQLLKKESNTYESDIKHLDKETKELSRKIDKLEAHMKEGFSDLKQIIKENQNETKKTISDLLKQAFEIK